MKHRGVDFDVEEDRPGLWRWKICPKIEAGPKVIGEPKYRTREAAVAACIDEINSPGLNSRAFFLLTFEGVAGYWLMSLPKLSPIGM